MMGDAAPLADRTALDDTSAEDTVHDDGYDGPAELVVDDEVVEVTVSLRGHFDPISGRYRWYGRVGASAVVAQMTARSARAVLLRTPHSQVETRLTDVDPWGRPRVEGFGAAPFPVLASLADDPS